MIHFSSETEEDMVDLLAARGDVSNVTILIDACGAGSAGVESVNTMIDLLKEKGVKGTPKVVTGSMWSFGVDVSRVPEFWRLDHCIVMGVSIFEYPWQILVLGLLMGMFGIVPLLVSQLI